jgi:DNA-binding NtrC family response regulator
LVRQAGVVIELKDVIQHVKFDGALGLPIAAGSLRDVRARFEREYIAAVLTRHDYQMASAAAKLGVERANLYRKIRQLGIPRRRSG